MLRCFSFPHKACGFAGTPFTRAPECAETKRARSGISTGQKTADNPKVCQQPRISIIVPVYNAEETLDRCVVGILAQTHSECEILLIDDGSTDNSAAIADAFASKDARVSVVHTPNQGGSAARNTSLDMATGDFIGFVDADDWNEPDMFAWLLACIERETADIAVCGYREEYGGGAVEISTVPAPPAATLTPAQAYRSVLETHWFGGYVCNKLFAAWLFAKDGCRLRFDETLHICEDLLLVCECLCHARKIVCDSRTLYHYVIYEGHARSRPFSARKATLLAARKKIIALTRQNFPELTRVAKNLYVTDVVHTFLLAVHDSADTACLKDDLKRIRGYALPYLFRKGNRFSYRMMAILLTMSPRMAEALRRRRRAKKA